LSVSRVLVRGRTEAREDPKVRLALAKASLEVLVLGAMLGLVLGTMALVMTAQAVERERQRLLLSRKGRSNQYNSKIGGTGELRL
jgi:hypothetical protein